MIDPLKNFKNPWETDGEYAQKFLNIDYILDRSDVLKNPLKQEDSLQSTDSIVSPGLNGIPVEIRLWDGKNNTYPAKITGGWERSINYLNQYKYTNTHIRGLHCAVDISYDYTYRVPIYSTHSGFVTVSAVEANSIYITNGAFRTVYTHLGRILVKDNQEIEAGTVIGYMGSVGTNNVHLHYEIQFNIPEIRDMPNTGEYGVFSSNGIWKSINPFTYEEAVNDSETQQPLGRVIPNFLVLEGYTGYFRNPQRLMTAYASSAYSVIGMLYTVPRSKALLNWLESNGL